MVLLLIASLGMLGYVYLGYPALLGLLVSLRGPRRVRQGDVTPSLSLVISAYNEADVIGRKIDNALALDYPPDRLEIVVISDCSDDGTDAIVSSYAGRGVRLLRLPQRSGKTVGLNTTVPLLAGEVVVFSDANAMYERDALRKLARNFADDRVGCVTGEARYLAGSGGVADAGERAYWDYEIQIKRLETALGSMVGGDGAIYALRRSLWRTLPDNAINDFLNPLQVVEAGWRAVYEPEAVCYEETAGVVRAEYRRRVRIVSRSWRAVFQAPGVLNPFRVGLFTWSLVSHKMLRWLSALFGAGVAAASLGLLATRVSVEPLPLLAAAIALVAIVAAAPPLRRAAGMLGYFLMIHGASIVGVIKGSIGDVSGVWSTPRAAIDRSVRVPSVPVGIVIQVAIVVAVAGTIALTWVQPVERVAAAVFWCSIVMLGYVYFGYPALLALARHVSGQAVRRENLTPRVCVFIAANDERAIIAEKLANTLSMDYPADRLDVVVASDGSVDGTNDIVRRFAPRVRLLDFSPRRGKMAVINEGLASVSSDIVVFSDANTFLEPDAVRALIRNFADPEVGAVSGDVVLVGERASLGRSEDLYYRYERWAQRAESEIGSMIGADGALYAIRRELFTPPPDDTILDDMAIPMAVIRSGHRVVFEGGARAFEQGSASAKEEFARKMRVIAGAVQFMRRRESAVPLAAPQVVVSLISHKALRWLSPMFVAGTYVSSAILAGVHVVYATALALQVGFLLLALAGCFRPLRRFSVIAIAHYFSLLQAAALVGFVRGLAGRQSVLWRRFDRSRPTAAVEYAHE